MGILRSDRVSGLGGANAINGSAFLVGGDDSAGRQTMNMKDSSLVIGTNEFCCDFWMYWVDIPSHGVRVVGNMNQGDYSNAQSWAYLRFADGTSRLWSGSAWTSTGADNFVAGRWYHISIIRNSGNTQALYIDGSIQSTTVSNSNNLTNDEFDINGRASDGAESGRIYFSNVRLTIGSGASDLGGVVPNGAPPVLTDTKILCCNDPGNILNESAQGISITTGRNTTSNASVGVASRFVPDKGEDYGTTFADNTKFDTLSYMVPPGGRTDQRGRGRGLFCGGRVGNTIQYVNIQSQGNAIDFGDDTGAAETIEGFGLASSTRAVFGGGQSLNAKMEYVTIATTSNTTSFGNLTVGRRSGCGFSNQTRGIIAGGIASGPSASDVMDYITIASTGNATDFGDLTTATQEPAGFSSPTRGIIAGGNTAPTVVNTIEYITIATTGDATNFGDLTVAGSGAAGSSSQTRGLIMGGMRPANNVTIDYVTIATTGDATDFGDLTQARAYNGAVSNSIRAVSAGGNANPVSLNTNTIDYVDIATTGNANDFGDLLVATRVIHGASDSHGGIS